MGEASAACQQGEQRAALHCPCPRVAYSVEPVVPAIAEHAVTALARLTMMAAPEAIGMALLTVAVTPSQRKNTVCVPMFVSTNCRLPSGPLLPVGSVMLCAVPVTTRFVVDDGSGKNGHAKADRHKKTAPRAVMRLRMFSPSLFLCALIPARDSALRLTQIGVCCQCVYVTSNGKPDDIAACDNVRRKSTGYRRACQYEIRSGVR